MACCWMPKERPGCPMKESSGCPTPKERSGCPTPKERQQASREDHYAEVIGQQGGPSCRSNRPAGRIIMQK